MRDVIMPPSNAVDNICQTAAEQPVPGYNA
jgi:hypothetical protein